MRTLWWTSLLVLAGCPGDPEETGDTGGVDLGAPPEAGIDPPGDLYRGATLHLTGTASDAEDDPTELSLALYSQRAGGLFEGAPAADGTWSWEGTLSEGEHELRLVVTDTDGNDVEVFRNVTVQGNAAPVCEIVSPDDGATYESGAVVPLRAEGTDPNEDTLKFFWYANDAGLVLGQEWDANLADGAWELRILVEDPDGLTCEDSVSITVGGTE